MFATVDPLSSRVDLAIRLNHSHDSSSCHLHLARFFEDPLQSRANVPLAPREQTIGPRMAVHARTIRESVFLGDGNRAAPCDEVALNFLPLSVGTDRAKLPRAPEADRFNFPLSRTIVSNHRFATSKIKMTRVFASNCVHNQWF